MFDAFGKGVSTRRLEAFRSTGGSDLEVLTACLWDTALCEAFYPSLQYLEVGLRNSIHDALSFTNKSVRWYKASIMCVRCREDVEKAEAELRRNGKDPNDPDRMIAELGFGFWTRLFNKHYQQPLWNNKTFLLRAFPNATQQQRSRHSFAVRIDGIRRFRNRIFHHEPIIGYDLSKFHHEIIETLGWINRDLVEASKIVDRFRIVNRKEYKDHLQNLCSSFFGPRREIKPDVSNNNR